MLRLPPRSPRTVPLLPYTTLFRALPADRDGAERRALIDALAALGRPVSVADERAQARELPPERQIAVAMARGDAALASWRDLPALAATWWLALSAERSGGSSLLAIAADRKSTRLNSSH